MSERITDPQMASLEWVVAKLDQDPLPVCADINLRRLLPRAVAELRELRAIVDKLPVTADGVTVVPGEDTVWRWSSIRGWVECQIETSEPEDGGWEYVLCTSLIGGGVDSCYSTREAAEAAKKEADDE